MAFDAKCLCAECHYAKCHGAADVMTSLLTRLKAGPVQPMAVPMTQPPRLAVMAAKKSGRLEPADLEKNKNKTV
jgi:hypothetical protein